MKTFHHLLLCCLFIFALPHLANAQTNWSGEFFFGEDGGETAGGTKIYIAHSIHISKRSGNTYDVKIESNGFQTFKQLLAHGRPKGKILEIFFRSKPDKDSSGSYKKGELLLTLERKEIKGKKKILTHWGAFLPSLDKHYESGKVRFEKN